MLACPIWHHFHTVCYIFCYVLFYHCSLNFSSKSNGYAKASTLERGTRLRWRFRLRTTAAWGRFFVTILLIAQSWFVQLRFLKISTFTYVRQLERYRYIWRAVSLSSCVILSTMPGRFLFPRASRFPHQTDEQKKNGGKTSSDGRIQQRRCYDQQTRQGQRNVRN